MSGSRTLIIIGFVIVAVAVAVGGYVLLRNMRGAGLHQPPRPKPASPTCRRPKRWGCGASS